MSRSSGSPVWPFMLVLLGLFAFSVTTPRDWERIARPKPMGRPRAASASLVVRKPHTQRKVSAARLEAPRLDLSAHSAPAPDEVCEIDPATDEAALDDLVSAESLVQESGAAIVQTVPLRATVAPADVAYRPSRTLGRPEWTLPQRPDEALSSADDDSAVATDESDVNVTDEAPGGRWPVPVDLVRRLDELSAECAFHDWAVAIRERLDELSAAPGPTDERADEILAKLRAMSRAIDGKSMVGQSRDVAVEVLRARHALVRRLDVWELISTVEQGQAAVVRRPEPARLSKRVAEVASLARQGGVEGERWRSYLMLDTLEALSQASARGADVDARAVAERVIGRLERAGLTRQHRALLGNGPLAELGVELRNWAVAPIAADELLADLEQFERTGLPSDARRLARHWRQLSWQPGDANEQLARRIETHYRNANLRIAVSESLLDRLVPPPSNTVATVRDRVLGHPTRGTSNTSTIVDVELVPDSNRLRLALAAHGEIFARTRTASGPATIFSQSDSSFDARKVLDIDLEGVHAWPATADARISSRLRGVETDFDGIPLVGALVDGVVRSRHAESEPDARREVRGKVTSRAAEQLDATADPQLAALNRKLEERLLEPLARLALSPTLIDVETTAQRMTMRLRLAGSEQLAGDSPRPQAPSDSLLSVQMHQSAINNACEQMNLNGRTYTVAELRRHVGDTLNLPSVRVDDDESDDEASITFAAENAAHVQCEDGRVKLTLSIAKLASRRLISRNFIVKVFYRPEVSGLTAYLARDGVVQLSGVRLRTKDQLALRGVFSRIFSQNSRVPLSNERWSDDPRLSDLRFSQFTIQDGWLGLAIGPGPRRVRENVARKP